MLRILRLFLLLSRASFSYYHMVPTYVYKPIPPFCSLKELRFQFI